jgi:hypothetical protein
VGNGRVKYMEIPGWHLSAASKLLPSETMPAYDRVVWGEAILLCA